MNEKVSRRRLPHWDRPGATYFVTTCLQGSLPAQGELAIRQLRAGLVSTPPPAGVPETDWRARNWKRVFAATDDWLDRRPAVRLLEQPRLARIVEASLRHFAGERYELIAWVVMPSHLHWVFRPLESWVAKLEDVETRTPRRRILQSVNGFSARECNARLNLAGRFWQPESYDHVVRDEGELERIVAYVHANPVRAGLVEHAEEYAFSSARWFVELEGGDEPY